MSLLSPRIVCIFMLYTFAATQVFAHNGSVAFAYPIGKVRIDGDFSDWPKNAAKYRILKHLSDTKPKNDADFSGYFQVAYNLEDQSLYLAFTIRDDDFVEDTSANVMWNTQDGLQLSIDARHLLTGSGVASFMYSKTLHTVNKAYYDPFVKAASWDIMEVAMTRKGDVRYYEWRVKLGKELTVGKSIGLDFNVMDKDSDDSFSWSDWGDGEMKFMNPNSLGDVFILPAGAKLATVAGKVSWDTQERQKLPERIRLRDQRNPSCWTQITVDSAGHYSAMVPEGNYELLFPDNYFMAGKKLYAIAQQTRLTVHAKGGRQVEAAPLVIPMTPVPDLIPEKGVLPDFTDASATAVDSFIEAYRAYYNIPGVSLALIKDGKKVYHKTYGVVNTMTGEKVNDNTLFEAASITKPVFAFAVERLAERGVIDLDKPLYEYLPYEDIAYDERYKLITARHVLTHRTGFPNWRDGKLKILFTPGTSFGYSGEGFEYLKMVVEKITGKKVEQVLQEEVIEPIGLYHTFFSKNDSLQKVVAYGHYNGLPSNNDLPESPGMAYSMHTEADIFTRFMLYLLEQKGLTPETYNTILSKHSEYDFSDWDVKPTIPIYMGMSLEIRETPFGKTFSHGGNNGDFKCKFEVYKDLQMGYVIFTNSNTSDALLDNLKKFLVEGRD